MTQWTNSSWQVYVQAVPGANMTAIQKKINDIKYQHDPNDKKISTYFASYEQMAAIQRFQRWKKYRRYD